MSPVPPPCYNTFRRSCTLILSLLILSTHPLFAAKLIDIDVLGNRNVNRDTIIGAIQFLKVGKEFTGEDAIGDRDNIEKLGLFQDVTYESRETTDGVVVIFRVVENPVVASITIEGNDHVQRADIEKDMETKVGNIVNVNSLRADRDKIVAIYRNRGYAADIKEVRYPGGDVTFVIVELRVNDIRVNGLKKTRFETVRRELHVKPGDLYDENQLRRAINRLRDLEIFDDVGFRPSVDESPPGTVDIVVEVKERKTGIMAFGLGASSRNEVVGYLSLNEGNWRGKAERIQLVTEVGDRRTYELLYTNPWFDKKHTSLHLLGGDRLIFREPRGILGSGLGSSAGRFFEERRKGAQISFTRPQDDREELFYTVGYRFEDVSLVQRDAVLANQVLSTSFGTVSAPSLGITRDTRDSRIDPNRGFRASTAFEVATSVLGSDASFQKMDFDIRKYLGVGKRQADNTYKDVVAGRFVYGKAFGTLPAFEQYFVGGAETIRGYDIDQQFGDNQVIANLELRHRIQKNLTAVAFLDWGGAWSGTFSNSQQFDPLFGKGMGIRVRTPLGPIRLDYGVGDRNRLHFSIGHPF